MDNPVDKPVDRCGESVDSITSLISATTNTWRKMPDALALDERLSHTAVRAYAALLALAGRREPGEECALPSIAEVARMLGCTRQALAKGVAELTATGWIVTRRGGHNRTLYRFAERTPAANSEVRETNALARASDCSSSRETLPSEACESVSLAVPPKLVRIDGRNVAFDALVEVTGADVDAEGGRIAAGLVKIRKLYWRDLPDDVKAVMDSANFEQGLAAEIRERASLYEIRYRGGVELTPTALAANWVRVTRQQPRRASNLEQWSKEMEGAT